MNDNCVVNTQYILNLIIMRVKFRISNECCNQRPYLYLFELYKDL